MTMPFNLIVLIAIPVCLEVLFVIMSLRNPGIKVLSILLDIVIAVLLIRHAEALPGQVFWILMGMCVLFLLVSLLTRSSSGKAKRSVDRELERRGLGRK